MLGDYFVTIGVTECHIDIDIDKDKIKIKMFLQYEYIEPVVKIIQNPMGTFRFYYGGQDITHTIKSADFVIRPGATSAIEVDSTIPLPGNFELSTYRPRHWSN